MLPPAPTMVPAGPGRRYTSERLVRLGDVLPSGTLRLDALARYLQDVATDDGVDAGIDRHLAWVVRRSVLRMYQRPPNGERLSLVTWASGTGSRWAERRTTVRAGGDVVAEAAALWVCVDARAVRAVRLSERFWEMYGEAAAGRAVSSRLIHPGPEPAVAAAGRPWPLRLADFDAFDHVNNAATWAIVEDEVARGAPAASIAWAELEYRSPIERDADVRVVSRVDAEPARVWVLADGVVVASAVLGLAAVGEVGRRGAG